MSTLTDQQVEAIRLQLDGMHLPKGIGPGGKEACSVAAINLALTGVLTDEIPNCMSPVVGKWIIYVQDAMPDAMRNSPYWRELLPHAAGTGQEREQERLDLILDWMWRTVLPAVQPVADARGFGTKWRQMCEQCTAATAAYAAAAAADAYATADAVYATAADAVYATAAYAAAAATTAGYAVDVDAADAAAYTAAATAAYAAVYTAAATAAYAAVYATAAAAADAAAYATVYATATATDAAATAAGYAVDAAAAAAYAADDSYANAATAFWVHVSPPDLLAKLVAVG